MGYYVEIGSDNGEQSVRQTFDSLHEAIRSAEQTLQFSLSKNVAASVINEQNGLVMWCSEDSHELKKYMEQSYDEWNTTTHGHHEASDKPSVYFDIDGTLGKWYSDGRGLPYEEIINPTNHYFRDIEPHEGMIELAKALHDKGVDVCIISAADKGTIRDKWEWIDEHLPFVLKGNICFSPIGADKSDFVKGNADISILIDDYNKNLEEWKGTSIKAINTVNSHQDKFPEIDFTGEEAMLHEGVIMTLETAVDRVSKQIEKMITDLDYEKESAMENKEVKTFEVETRFGASTVEIEEIKAIAERSDENREVQDALLIHDLSDTYHDGDQIIFGCGMPADNEEASAMIENENTGTAYVDVFYADKNGVYHAEVGNVEELYRVRKSDYEEYKAEWIQDHISDETMTATEAAYENNEETKGMTFDEYVEEYGFADGSCYASYDEFFENEYTEQNEERNFDALTLAMELESFMYWRGEYDYPKDDHIRWLDGIPDIYPDDENGVMYLDNDAVSAAREIVVDNIEKSLSDFSGRESIRTYLEDELAVMDEEDELIPQAKDLLKDLKKIDYALELSAALPEWEKYGKGDLTEDGGILIRQAYSEAFLAEEPQYKDIYNFIQVTVDGENDTKIISHGDIDVRNAKYSDNLARAIANKGMVAEYLSDNDYAALYVSQRGGEILGVSTEVSNSQLDGVLLGEGAKKYMSAGGKEILETAGEIDEFIHGWGLDAGKLEVYGYFASVDKAENTEAVFDMLNLGYTAELREILCKAMESPLAKEEAHTLIGKMNEIVDWQPITSFSIRASEPEVLNEVDGFEVNPYVEVVLQANDLLYEQLAIKSGILDEIGANSIQDVINNDDAQMNLYATVEKDGTVTLNLTYTDYSPEHGSELSESILLSDNEKKLFAEAIDRDLAEYEHTSVAELIDAFEKDNTPEYDVNEVFKEAVKLADMEIVKTKDGYGLIDTQLDDSIRATGLEGAEDIAIEIDTYVKEALINDIEEEGNYMTAFDTLEDMAEYGKEHSETYFVKKHQLEFDMADLIANRLSEVDVEKAFPEMLEIEEPEKKKSSHEIELD
jgi:5'(3')-deoxyribonucleotidase